jgi:hypothetical protein
MSELNAKVMVLPSTDEVGVSGDKFKPLTDEQIGKISNIIRQTVGALKADLTSEAEKEPGKWGLSEIEMSFGIDIEGQAETSLILRPIGAFRTKAGATFEVKVTLARD